MEVICDCGKHIPRSNSIKRTRGLIFVCEKCGTSYDIEVIKSMKKKIKYTKNL